MIEKYYLNLIISEAKNFKELQKLFGYSDLNDLIAHYIEEGVITSKEELVNVLEILKKELGISVKEKTFNEWWVGKRQCTIYNLLE